MDIEIPLIKKSVTYFLNTKEMSLWHYSKYLETDDLRYFSNYFDLKRPKEPSEAILQKSIALIFGEMLEITQAYAVLQRFINIDKIYKLETKYLDVKRLVSTIRTYESSPVLISYKPIIEQLQKWHYKIDTKKDLLPQLDKIERRVEGIQSEIESLRVLLRKDQKQEKQDIDEAIYNAQQGLQMNYKIDKRKTTLFEWLLKQKSLKKKIEVIERSNQKKNK